MVDFPKHMIVEAVLAGSYQGWYLMPALYHGGCLRPPLYQDRLLRLFLYQDGNLWSRLPFLSMIGDFSSTRQNQPLQQTGALIVAAEDPSGNLRRRSSLGLWGGGAMCWLLVGKGESGQFRPSGARLKEFHPWP